MPVKRDHSSVIRCLVHRFIGLCVFLFLSLSLSMPTLSQSLPPDAISLASWKSQAQYRQIKGHNIAYWTAGKGQPLLMIHGFPTASWDWQHLWGPLSSQYQVIALDMLGYGFSDKPWPHDYSIIEQADIALTLMDALGHERFHLIAHDYGDSVAQELLFRHNTRVAENSPAKGFLLSLCLLNGGLFPEAQHHTLAQHLLLSPLGPFLTRFYTQGMFNRNFSDIFAEQSKPNQQQLGDIYALISENGGQQVFAGLIHYINERHRNRDRWVGALQQSTVPIRVIDGTDDRLAGENMLARYEALIANPDIVRLAHVGHYPQLEAPTEVLGAYLPFLVEMRNAQANTVE